MDAKELLIALIPAIEEIDGGCSVCIERFCRSVNLILTKRDVAFRLEVSPEETPVRVRLI